MHITTIVLDLNIAHSRDAVWCVGKGFADSATLIAVKAAMLCQLASGRSKMLLCIPFLCQLDMKLPMRDPIVPSIVLYSNQLIVLCEIESVRSREYLPEGQA
jgi:hypothetical protein